MTVYHFVDVSIPAGDLDLAMAASDAIEQRVGSADTGFGFGYRDLSIECSDELDQENTVLIVQEELTARGISFVVGHKAWDDIATVDAASIVSRASDNEEDEADEENMTGVAE